jgi:hypothetical protein
VAAKKNHKYVATFLVDQGIDLNVLTDEGISLFGNIMSWTNGDAFDR